MRGPQGEKHRPRNHSLEGDSWTRWTHEVRRIEFNGMVGYIPLGDDSTVLELGCGDGFQLGLLRARFARVLAIDPENAPACSEGFVFASAEALPFGDATFDSIVSNCVLEHLEDRPRGISEAVRVLRPGGYMAHVVPSRYWKATSLVFNPIGYPLRVLEKWKAWRQASGDRPSSGVARGARPGILQVLGRWIYPPIHGTYTSHLAEYQSYGRDRWLETFRHPQLSHVADAPLVCATQFGFLRFRFLRWRKWLAGQGLSSSRVFAMRRIA